MSRLSKSGSLDQQFRDVSSLGRALGEAAREVEALVPGCLADACDFGDGTAARDMSDALLVLADAIIEARQGFGKHFDE